MLMLDNEKQTQNMNAEQDMTARCGSELSITRYSSSALKQTLLYCLIYSKWDHYLQN